MRPENILVEGEKVWIIDFEFAEILDDEGTDLKFQEMEAVKQILREIKQSQECGAAEWYTVVTDLVRRVIVVMEPSQQLFQA